MHLAVVDPGVGGPRRAVAVQTERNWYVAPDNGVLTQVLADEAVTKRVDITGFVAGGGARSATFYGPDIFAPVCGLLASGVPLADLGPPASDPVRVDSRPTRGEDGTVRGRVLFADSFGNLVSNVRCRDVPGDTRDVRLGNPPALSVGSPVSHYAAVAEGAALAVWNSYDLLEIALNGGHMAERVGWRPGSMLAVTVER